VSYISSIVYLWILIEPIFFRKKHVIVYVQDYFYPSCIFIQKHFLKPDWYGFGFILYVICYILLRADEKIVFRNSLTIVNLYKSKNTNVY